MEVDNFSGEEGQFFGEQQGNDPKGLSQQSNLDGTNANQEQWDGQQYKFVYKGKDVVPEGKDKLLKWAQIGYSTNDRSEHLNRLKSELDQRAQRVEQFERINEAFENNPHFKQQIMDLYNKSVNGQGVQQTNYNGYQQDGNGNDEIYSQLMGEINSLKQKQQMYENYSSDNLLKKEIEELKSAYKDVLDLDGIDDITGEPMINTVLRKSHENGGIPLETAAILAYREQIEEAKKASWLKEYTKSQMEKKKAGIVSAGSAIGHSNNKNNFDVSKLSYDDITRHLASRS